MTTPGRTATGRATGVARSTWIVQSWTSARMAPTAARIGANTAPTTPDGERKLRDRPSALRDDDAPDVAFAHQRVQLVEHVRPFDLDRLPTGFHGHRLSFCRPHGPFDCLRISTAQGSRWFAGSRAGSGSAARESLLRRDARRGRRRPLVAQLRPLRRHEVLRQHVRPLPGRQRTAVAQVSAGIRASPARSAPRGRRGTRREWRRGSRRPAPPPPTPGSPSAAPRRARGPRPAPGCARPALAGTT